MTVYALGKKNKIFMTSKKSITYKFYKAFPMLRWSLETTKCARLLISIP